MSRTDSRARVAEAWETTRPRVAEAWERTEPARDRISDETQRVVDRVEPTVLRARDAAAEGVHRVEEQAPGLVERVLDVLRSLVTRASEEVREAAYHLEEPRSRRRRRRWQLAAWAAGGFGLGFAVGWAAHARYQDQGLDEWEEPPAGTVDAPYGAEAAAIDARRESAPLN